MIRLNPFRIGAVAIVAACVGCPGSLEDPGRFSSATGACGDVPTTVFQNNCSATAGCHSSTDKQMGLDLQSPNVASRLIGIKSVGGTGLLVDPSNPSASVLYTKLTASPPFGARMPFGEPALDQATIACVLQWITTQVSDGGGAEDGSMEASSDDGPPALGDDGSQPGDDGSSPNDATTNPPPDTGTPPPPMDAGKDAKAPPKDAGNPPMDASQPKDSGGGTPPSDAAGD
jgi:hypothetical protein